MGSAFPTRSEGVVSLDDLQASSWTTDKDAMSEMRFIQPDATSSNVVGYIKLILQPGWSLVTRQLFDGEERVGSSFKDAMPGMVALGGDREGWRVSNFLDGWSDPDLPLAPGSAVFVFNPGTNAFPVTFVGEVRSGTTVIEIPAGRSLVGSVIPQQMVPGPEFGLPLESGSVLRRWVGEDFSIHPFEAGWLGSPPVVRVAEGFVLEVQRALTWGRTFEINGGVTKTLRHAETLAYRISLPPLTNETPQVNLFTWNRDQTRGRILDVDGATPLGDGFVAELWGSATATGPMEKLGGPYSFRSGPSAGWIREGAVSLPPGFAHAQAWLQLRVWYRPWSATFEAAALRQERFGRSGLVPVPVHSVASVRPLAPVNGFLTFQLSSRPRIGALPLESLVTEGTDFALDPAVVASGPVAWQWTHKPVGETVERLVGSGANLFLREVTAADAGIYRLDGTNAFGSASPLSTRVRVVAPRPVEEVFGSSTQKIAVGGHAGWFGQVTDRHTAPSAARSGTVGDTGESWLETQVIGPGVLAYWWKVSSETNWDMLEIRLDGEVREAISGEVDWNRRTLEIPAGEHSVRWRYAKDASLSAGLDHAWLDEVVFVPRGVVPSIVTQPESREVPAKTPVTLRAEAKGFPEPEFQWMRNGEPIPGATNSSLLLESPGRLAAGTYTVQVSNAAGSATSNPAVLTVVLEPPPLRWASAGEALLVTWPTDEEFVLEAAGRMGAGAEWSPVPEPPLLLGDQSAFPIAPTGAAKFYRLRLR